MLSLLVEKRDMSAVTPPLYEKQVLTMNNTIFYSSLRTLLAWLIAMTMLPQYAYGAYYSHALPTQSLLPVATVHCIFQDSEGFMWYGTTGGGLCRDNGYQVNVFRSDWRTPGLLNSNNVRCIEEDSVGTLWFGTDTRLYRLEKQTFRITEPLPRQEMNVNTLFLDSHRNMWVGTAGDVFCINPADGRTLLHVSMRGMGSVSQILEDSHHRVWVTTWEGALYKYDAAARKLAKMPWTLASGIVRMVEDVAQRGFWVATWGDGIVFYDAVKGQTIVQPGIRQTSDGGRCVDMLIDKTQGMVWLTTYDDLYLYKREGRRLVPQSTTDFVPAGRKILDGMCEDRAGNIWVAGFTPHTFIVSSSEQSVVREEIPAVSQQTGYPLLPDRMVADGNGFWIWQGRVGLMYYDADTRILLDASDMRIARGMCKDRGNAGIWAYRDNTLKHLRYAGGRVEEQNVSTFPAAVSCISDNGGGTVWVGTENAIYRYSVSGGTASKVCVSPSKVIAMAGTADGTQYFATNARQVFRCTADGAKHVLTDGISENFTSLAVAPDGTLWAVTQQGSVYSLPCGGRTMERRQQMSNANGDAINSVKVDRAGHVWLLSNQYVREYNPRNNAFRIMRNTDSDIAVSYFYTLEEVDDNTIAADGAGAYLQFRSSRMLDQQGEQGDRPYVTALQMGDSLLLTDTQCSGMEIPADVHSLILQCSTLDPVNAAKVCFAYKLEGWNKEWVYLPQGVNTIYLSNLPKGRFRLLLRATDRYGCWSLQEAEYTLHRLPSWWETWWAYLLYIAIAAASGYGLWRLNRRIRFLLLLQQRRKALSLTEVAVKPEELGKGGGSADLFLKQVVEKIESHIGDSAYGVEQLSSDMCMSRMSLYRKVQSVSGLSPNEFIKDIRLKKAASILKRHPDMPIGTLAAKVGFGTVQYFSKCFKKKFGVLPSQYK